MIAEFTAGRGARLMDRTRPTWFLRVDRESLDMRSYVNCILGQEYGSYYRGLHLLKIGAFRAASYGFTAFTAGRNRWRKLNAAWLAEIAARTTTPVPVNDRDRLVLTP